MNVVRDLLDRLVVDRNGHEMGRVDGILLKQEKGKPPHLAAVLIGPAALGSRIHPALGMFAAKVEKWLGVDRDAPARIDCAEIHEIGQKIRVRLSIGDSSVDAVERRLRLWVLKLPGSR